MLLGDKLIISPGQMKIRLVCEELKGHLPTVCLVLRARCYLCAPPDSWPAFPQNVADRRRVCFFQATGRLLSLDAPIEIH